MPTIPKTFGQGQARVDRMTSPNLYDFLLALATDLAEVKAKFDAHQHGVDGTALGATSDITSTPVTGTATGAPDGGTATSIDVTLEAE